MSRCSSTTPRRDTQISHRQTVSPLDHRKAGFSGLNTPAGLSIQIQATGWRRLRHRGEAQHKKESYRSTDFFHWPAIIATAYGDLGEKDKAFAWLEKAYAEKSTFIAYLKPFPDFDSLRSDPRYKDLLKRMDLPQ
jgi:hypothetical protein